MEYLKRVGLEEYIHTVGMMEGYKNKWMYFKLFRTCGYHLGFTESCYRLGYFCDDNGSFWDPDYAPGIISCVTDYLCQNWDKIRDNFINNIAKDIESKQKRELDDALNQLKHHTGRIIV